MTNKIIIGSNAKSIYVWNIEAQKISKVAKTDKETLKSCVNITRGIPADILLKGMKALSPTLASSKFPVNMVDGLWVKQPITYCKISFIPSGEEYKAPVSTTVVLLQSDIKNVQDIAQHIDAKYNPKEVSVSYHAVTNVKVTKDGAAKFCFMAEGKEDHFIAHDANIINGPSTKEDEQVIVATLF